MKRLRKQHVLEQSIYGAIWIVIFLLPLIGGYFAMSGGLEREETRMVIRESWLSILPFFVLFLLNNYGLVPYFLFKKRYWQYTVSLIFVIGMICWLSPFSFANHSPKDFKRGELPLRMKENRRDQIIKMREKAREEGDVHWYESNPEQRPRGMGDPNGPGRFPKPTPFPYPPFVLRYLIHFIIAFLMVGFNIAIKLFGDDLNKMFSLGNRIKDAIGDIPGIADLNVEQQIERPQLKIQPKREMLAKFGITLPEFSEYVNVALAGKVISQVYEQGKSFDLIVKVKDDARDEMEKIRNLMVDTNDGRKVPLNYVAEVVSAMGPNTINRENVKRKIVISANVADRDLRSVVNDIQKRIDTSIQLPEGYHIEYGGQFESEQAASRTLALTSFISIVVIFLLLYNEFRSVKESGVILLNLPLALIGGVFALVITTGEVSIPAIIGFISLFGIATRNGMLLISHYNHLQKEEGLNVYDSVMQGSLDRLNPILMTALSSALALIPLALGGDLPGNEIQSPMAKVILGGLLTSTFLNGFIVPIVYLMMHRRPTDAAPEQESLATPC